MDKLTARDLQDIGLAEHAETYIKEQSMNQNNQRSKANSADYQDFKSNMQEKYGGA